MKMPSLCFPCPIIFFRFPHTWDFPHLGSPLQSIRLSHSNRFPPTFFFFNMLGLAFTLLILFIHTFSMTMLILMKTVKSIMTTKTIINCIMTKKMISVKIKMKVKTRWTNLRTVIVGTNFDKGRCHQMRRSFLPLHHMPLWRECKVTGPKVRE